MMNRGEYPNTAGRSDLDQTASMPGRKRLPPREIGGIREIMAFPQGLRLGDVTMLSDATPHSPDIESALQAARAHTQQQRVDDVIENGGTPDHNGPKVWLEKVDYTDGRLRLTTGPTKYFDLWGMPGKAPELHKQFLRELPDNHKTVIPNGIATENTIVTSDELMIMTVRSRAVGFAAGRVSTTFEEQMEPEDGTPFHTVVRGLAEEYGVAADIDSIKLLGLGAEKNTAYTAASHFGETTLSAQDFAEAWHDAPEKDEGTALFAVPLNKIEAFTQDAIPHDIWLPYIVGGEVPASATLNPHPAVPWRITLVQEHMAQSK